MIPPKIQRIVTRVGRLLNRWRSALELRCISKPSGGIPRTGVLIFAVLRNESLRLPAFFRHYEKMGVAGYIIVDNNSTDGTDALLASRNDVLLLSTTVDFVGKERWINHLLHKHGCGRWCLVVDADELIDYPHSDQVRLPELCRYLDQKGSNALHAVLLDLYPDGPLSEVDYQVGEDYFERDWYFDPFSSLVKAPRPFYRGSGLDFRFKGGMRRRLFGVDPCCSKFPLLRFDRSMFLTDGQHYLEGAHFSGLSAVLYHFKYLQDFAPHVLEEAARNQYVWAADEYEAYARRVSTDSSALVFRNEASVKLTDISQLEECGFVTCPADFAPSAAS